jgi:predicted SprT family Zn-dependent metalloprotease
MISDKEIRGFFKKSASYRLKGRWTYGGAAVEYEDGTSRIYMNKKIYQKWYKKFPWAVWSIYLHELAHTGKRASLEAEKRILHGKEWAEAYLGLARRAEGLFWFLGY